MKIYQKYYFINLIQKNILKTREKMKISRFFAYYQFFDFVQGVIFSHT